MLYLMLSMAGLPEIATTCSFSCQKGYSTGNHIASADSFELTLVSCGHWEVSLLDQHYDVKAGWMKVYPPMVARTAKAVGEGEHHHKSIYMSLPADYKVLTQEQFEKQAHIYCTQQAFDTFNTRLFLPLLCDLSEKASLIQRFDTIIDQECSDSPYRKIRASCLLQQLLMSISESSLNKALAPNDRDPINASVVQKMIVYINSNYTNIVRLEQIADDLKYNASYLSTAFRKYTGTSTVDYINHLRVEKAKTMIEVGEKNFSEIAQEVGMRNVYYFYRIFKKYTKMTMGEYSRMFYR